MEAEGSGFEPSQPSRLVPEPGLQKHEFEMKSQKLK